MKNSDMNLMDDNQNEWEDDDPDCKRFRVRKVGCQSPLVPPNLSTVIFIMYAVDTDTNWCVFQFEEQAMLDLGDHTDHRKWTQQHLDAADLRIETIAPTPPQGDIENGCMDVNVRGPGVYTEKCTVTECQAILIKSVCIKKKHNLKKRP